MAISFEHRPNVLLVFGAAALVVLLAGCGRFRYSYAPVTTTSAEVAGHSAAIAAMPADGAKGELRIASLGVANVTPPSGAASAPFRARDFPDCGDDNAPR